MEQPEISTMFPIWLMRTKISPSGQLVSLIERPELIRKLNKGLNGKVTLISTPPGYGKSTLLSSWRQALIEQGCHVAWLTLDDDDNEPGLLATYIAYSMWASGLGVTIDNLTEEGGFGPHISPKTTLGILSAAAIKSQKKLILILDDFEKLNSKAIQSVIQPALKYFPENIHIVIACRATTHLSLSDFRLSGQLNELGSLEMKFTVVEIKNFLEQFLNKKQIQQTLERTEGWPVALQYLRLLLSQSIDQQWVLDNFKGSGQDIDSYFSEHFLNGLNDQQKYFLIDLSILEYINIDAANYLRERTDSELLLDEMREMVAFIIPVADGKNHFRLHPLLQEFLQHHLRINYPERFIHLYKMAANWYAKEGNIIRAMKYALVINDQELAADIIESAGGVLLWNREGMARIRTANALLSETVISGRPKLQLMNALILLKDGRLNEAREIIQHVRQIDTESNNSSLNYDIAILAATLDTYEGSAHSIDSSHIREQLVFLGKEDKTQQAFVHTTRCVSSYQRGYFDIARDCANQGTAILKEFKMPFGIVYFDIHLAVIDFAEGKLNDAFSRYQKAQNSIRHYFSDDKDIKLVSNILMAEWYFEHNDISTAQRLLGDTNDRLVHGEAWYEIYAAGYSTSSAIAYEIEGIESCKKLTEEANLYIQREGLKRLRRLTNANMAGYLTRSGMIKEARQLVQQNGLSLEEYKTPEINNNLIRERYGVVVALTRLLIAEKRYQEAIIELTFFLKIEQQINHNRAVLKYSLLMSIVLFLSGKKKSVFTLLNNILSNVRKESYVRLVLDESPNINLLLESYIKSNIAKEKDHAIYLLSFLNETTDPQEELKLSSRECQVIEQLAKGLSDKIIARNLDVSNNTIRFHLKNIYLKLGVNNRLQAVKAAANLTTPSNIK